jgi:hypothetical protein
MAKGTLIRTETIHGLFHGMVTDYHYHSDEGYITIFVTWNDCDHTEETFLEQGDYDYDTVDYFFYHKDRWWLIEENFYKFKQVLEG